MAPEVEDFQVLAIGAMDYVYSYNDRYVQTELSHPES